MALLLLGLLLWSGVHLYPALAAGSRGRLIERVGTRPYKGLFALAIVASVVLIVWGWNATGYRHVYIPPAWGLHATALLVLIAAVLFAAAQMRTNLRRLLRHPQLTGVVVWACGHLLANGDLRSILLFGGLALWALVEIAAINRREGAWRRPEAVPTSADLRTAGIGVAAYVVLLLLHPYLFGVAPVPGMG